MEEYLIEYIDSHDFDLNCTLYSFSSAYGFIRKKRGFQRRNTAKFRRYLKKLARRQTRRYFKSVVAGKKGKIRFISSRDL